jgi:hypothetical protein
MALEVIYSLLFQVMSFQHLADFDDSCTQEYQLGIISSILMNVCAKYIPTAMSPLKA